MAVYRGGEDLAQRIRAQSFSKDGPLKPHKATDSLDRLHQRLGCHKQYSIPIGFFYAKWSEKLHFYLTKQLRQERGHSSASLSRSSTPLPRSPPRMLPTSTRSEHASSRKPPERHLKSPKIASSSAAGVGIGMSIETAEENLNDLRMRRAAIFSETEDGMLTKEEKAVFWYREGRRQAWKAVASEVMMNETEWNDHYDRVELEKLRFIEEPLVSLLEEHKKSIGHGPAGQESN